MTSDGTSAGTSSVALRQHRGIVVLILGILGILCTCMPLGIVAWVLGHQELKDIDAGLVDPAGRGTVQAGKILGIVSVSLWALAILVGVGIVLVCLLTGVRID
jgi:K+ transporter